MNNSKINAHSSFLDLAKKANLSQNKSSINKYYNFIGVFILTLLICFLKEPIMNLLVMVGNYRREGGGDIYYYAYQNKEAYLKQIKTRKIVITGGSSALMGIDAQKIEASTGIPAVNMGVGAWLGVDYILDNAKKALKPGDIVILSIEYPLYYEYRDEQLVNGALNRYIISYDHDYFNELNLFDKLKVLSLPFGFNKSDVDTITHLLKGQFLFDKKLVYQEMLKSAKAGECTGLILDRNGDETCGIGKSPENYLASFELKPDKNDRPIDPSGSIRDFCKYARKNRITIVPIFPGTLYFSDYDSVQYKPIFAKIKNFWLQQGIPFKDSPSKSFIPLPMMFNSIYHPNEKGRNKRTKIILDILQSYQKPKTLQEKF